MLLGYSPNEEVPMTEVDPQQLAQWQSVAEAWLKRPLTPEEVQQLQAFLSKAGAVDLGQVYQSMAQATGILFENAVSAQQQQNTLSQAAANQGVMQIYGVDTTAAAGATEKLAQTGVADNLTSLLTVLKAFGQSG
jgi:hypothetical protein